jgi:hypothetical protein
MTHQNLRAALLGTAALLATSLPAAATTIYTTLASWTAAVAPAAVNNTTALGPNRTDVTSVSLVGGGSLSFATSNIRTIGAGWATWSGGYTGQVLARDADSITVTLSGIEALGFEVEPNRQFVFDVTVTLDDGSSETLGVNGLAGAQFFGFADASIASVTISADSAASGFAFGNFYSAVELSEVPAPAALGLFGLGLLGLAALRRR